VNILPHKFLQVNSKLNDPSLTCLENVLLSVVGKKMLSDSDIYQIIYV